MKFKKALSDKVRWRDFDDTTVNWEYTDIPIPVWAYVEAYDHWNKPKNQQSAIDQYLKKNPL